MIKSRVVASDFGKWPTAVGSRFGVYWKRSRLARRVRIVVPADSCQLVPHQGIPHRKLSFQYISRPRNSAIPSAHGLKAALWFLELRQDEAGWQNAAWPACSEPVSMRPSGSVGAQCRKRIESR